ncbi:MAG: ABC transporter ATP-binding protein [bacterium]
MEADSPLVTLVKVSKHYESPVGGHKTPVLDEIDLEVGKGESLAVVGPSGSGKSTLLNVIGGLDRPSSGQVYVAGRDLSTLAEQDLAQVRNQEIGFVFQRHHLLGQLTVLENVLVPCLMLDDRSKNKNLEEQARGLLTRVGLEQRMSYWPGQLSGGEQQRVAVVRALINQPRLLLADEPSGSLDRSASQEIADLLTELNQQEGVTLIVVTHNTELACRMGRVLELRDRRLSPLEKSG